MGTKELSKMGTSKVTITEFEGILCVQKQDASPVEIGFYQFAAPQLEGVNTPRLIGVRGRDLFIEYIPNSVNLNDLHANKSTFEQLANIHKSKYHPSFDIRKHGWTSEATENALLALDLPETTRESFRCIQSLSDELFNHKILISGDSNEGNWGTRNCGQLVLFDWERFGVGSPAIDLAPLVRQLGAFSDYESIVEKYTRHSSALSEMALVRHLVLAKSWLIIEVTNLLISRNKPDASIYINWYRQNVPNWLASVEKAL